MERIKRNPGGYGLALGGTIGIVSVLFSWVSVTNTVTNVTSNVPAHGTVSGQTLGLIGLLAVICRPGGGRVRRRCGRILWAILGLLGAGTILVAGLVAIFNPESRAVRDDGAVSSSLTASRTRRASIKAGFARDRRRVAFGAIVGVAGGRSASSAHSGFGKNAASTLTVVPTTTSTSRSARAAGAAPGAMRATTSTCAAVNEPNIRYATGASAMPIYAMSTFVRCAVVPAEGRPILFEHGNSMHRSRQSPPTCARCTPGSSSTTRRREAAAWARRDGRRDPGARRRRATVGRRPAGDARVPRARRAQGIDARRLRAGRRRRRAR